MKHDKKDKEYFMETNGLKDSFFDINLFYPTKAKIVVKMFTCQRKEYCSFPINDVIGGIQT